MTSRRTTPILAAAVLAAASAPAAQKPAEKVKDKEKVRATVRVSVAREAMEQVEAGLDRAVDRVSVPHAALLLGRPGSARGYRLPGYGVVFVLTPRALPGNEGAFYVLHGPRRRLRVESRRPEAEEEQRIEALERQVLVLQYETEAARRAAEEDMERIVHDVRGRLAPAPAEEPPPPPEAPSPPAPPAAVPAPAPMPPPWRFWFETGTQEDGRAPEAVIADVRAAVLGAIEGQARSLAGLGGDERVTVTVDFVPGGLFASHGRPARTLVVTARIRDIEARARGAIAPEELRRRVEVVEY
jgi:hypothetical protein